MLHIYLPSRILILAFTAMNESIKGRGRILGRFGYVVAYQAALHSCEEAMHELLQVTSDGERRVMFTVCDEEGHLRVRLLEHFR